MNQLRLDGSEETGMAVSVSRHTPRIPATYVDVLHHIRRVGYIRPVEAGLILYAHVEDSERAIDHRAKYASSDGSELLRRMAKRGLVHWAARGRWELGAPAEPVRLRPSEGGDRGWSD